MRRAAPFLIALLLFALAYGAAAVAQQRARTTIDVDEIQPGMQGTGLTVFEGTTPTQFGVRVIGILHNFRPDQDLILVRTDHPILDHAQVVAGCSGSPIYLDGRLAGAYAYGWPFGTDPVVGVTPIRNMLTEMRRPSRPGAFPIAAPLGPTPRPSATLPRRHASLPAYLGDGEVDAYSALHAHAARFGLVPGPATQSTMVPAATPLLVGGLTDAAVAEMARELDPLGLIVMQAGGGGGHTPPNAPTRYENGSAIAVELVRGDVSMAGIGTVTMVDGNRLVAFGHPMLNSGEPGLPTAIASIAHVLASEARSMKLGEPVRDLGAMVQDRQSAIVIDTSITPAMVPVRVRVTGVEGAPRTEWNMEVASHRVLTPTLIAGAVTSALGATVADSDDVMFEATSRLFVAGRSRPLEVVDRGYSHSGAAGPSALAQLRLFAMLEAVYANPFEEARADRIEIDLAVRFARDVVEVVDASISGAEVNPGTNIPMRIVLRRFDHSEEVRVVPLAIPAELAGETVEVQIQPGNVVRPETPLARNLDDIFATIGTRYPNTSLVVSMRSPLRGLRFSGHVARSLPASALDTLQLGNDSDRNRPFITYDRRELPLDRVVTGGARLEVRVRRIARQ